MLDESLSDRKASRSSSVVDFDHLPDVFNPNGTSNSRFMIAIMYD